MPPFTYAFQSLISIDQLCGNLTLAGFMYILQSLTLLIKIEKNRNRNTNISKEKKKHLYIYRNEIVHSLMSQVVGGFGGAHAFRIIMYTYFPPTMLTDLTCTVCDARCTLCILSIAIYDCAPCPLAARFPPAYLVMEKGFRTPLQFDAIPVIVIKYLPEIFFFVCVCIYNNNKAKSEV